MPIDYKKIAAYLSKHDLWGKCLADFDTGEMKDFCDVILDATAPKDGFIPPSLENETLFIPFRAPLKYRWWQGGQSILETLEEIDASDEIKAKYVPTRKGEGLRR